MEFTFEGFGTSLHWLLIFLLISGSVALSWFTYKSISNIKPWQKISLISLRSATFLLLLAVLLNPLFNIIETDQIRSSVAIIFDNSASTTIEKGEYSGLESYREVISHLAAENEPNIRFRTFGFDRNIFPAQPDTLSFDGSGTDISRAITQFLDEREDERALIFVSDGIFNTGRDLSWLATRLDFPVYTVAIGDNSRLQDIIVQDVIHNEIGYTNTISPVSATIRNDGMPGQEIEIQLRRDGDILESKTISTTQERSIHTVRFELLLEDEGFQQYEIHVPEIEGEWTTENNTQAFSIEVLDDRINVMLLSFEIHPDIRAWRSILLTDESIRLDSRTWLGDDRFLEGEFPAQADSIQLVILHGFPTQNIPQNIIQQVQNYVQGTPMVWLASPKSDFRLVQQFLPNSPIRGGRGTEFFDVRLALSGSSTSHPILELPEIDFRTTPPLFSPIRNLNADSDAEILLNPVFRNNTLETPLLSLRSIGNTRTAFISAHGWFKWYLNGGEIRRFTEEFMNNVIKWTSTSDDESLLRIRPSRNVIQETENVVLNAFLRNESGLEEDDASIDVVITGGAIQERRYTMINEGLGQYRLNAGNLPQGTYNFTATAQKDNRLIDERSGQFLVGSSNQEFINTVRNDEFLEFLANETGGQFFEWQDANLVMDQLRRDGHNEFITQSISSELRAYQNPFWFILVILFLSAEWIIRKIASLP